MSLSDAKLPENIDELRVFAASLQTEVQVYKDELYAKTLHIEKLKAQLAVLRRARFGRSSEKLDREIEQIELTLGDLEEGAAENTARLKGAAPQASLSSRRQPQEQGLRVGRCRSICRANALSMKPLAPVPPAGELA